VSPASRARRAFSPREASKIEIDFFGQGQVQEQRALPSLPGGLQPQLTLALGDGIRFGGQQPGVDVGGLPATAGRRAQLGAVGRLVLAEQQVIRLPLDYPALLEADCLRARTPPSAGRLAAGLAGLDVIPGRVLGGAAVDLLPDVVKFVALAQGRDNGQAGLTVRGPESAELTTVVGWCMGDRFRDHGSIVTKRTTKIRNEVAECGIEATVKHRPL
jgi:hypothetical protein